MAPVKRKRVSKKNKKSWRKNVDIKDVDNFLEDQRLEERLGKKYAEEKNEDLFHIDTKGKDDNTETSNDNVADIKPNGNLKPRNGNVSMRLGEPETPKCFEALVKRTAVPPFSINKIKKGKVGKNKKIKFKKAGSFKKENKNVLQGKSVLQQAKFTYDVWSKENTDRQLNGCSEWLTNDTIRHTLHNTGKVTKEVPKTVQTKTSLLPAIESPHPGLSYNPSLKDHTDILGKVAEAEMNVITEENHLDRVTTKMFKKVSEDKLKKQWLSEMTVGLSMSKTESDEEDDGEYRAVNPPVRNKKKTLQKRRKLKEALLLKEKLKQQKIEKRKVSDIYKLRKFNEALNKKEEKILKNIEKRKQLKSKKPFTTKLLSQTKYVEPEIDFSLAEELSGNLRGVKPEGNLLYDRYKSLQKRNILQPAQKRHVKKRKMKKYERAHTKMGWEPKGYEPFTGKKDNEK